VVGDLLRLSHLVFAGSCICHVSSFFSFFAVASFGITGATRAR
jgi:hypothetical protein